MIGVRTGSAEVSARAAVRIATLLQLLRNPSECGSCPLGYVQDALDCVAAFVDAADEARIVDGVDGPLVVEEFPASHAPELAPTVLCCGRRRPATVRRAAGHEIDASRAVRSTVEMPDALPGLGLGE